MLLSDLKIAIKKIEGIVGTSPDEEIDPNISVYNFLLRVSEIEFDKLKFLLRSDSWPDAVSSLCENSQDKILRAENILKHSLLDLNGKKFLDFGCGEGHVVNKAIEYGVSISYGYDPYKQWIYSNGILFNDIRDINQKFDIIFIYDVLDHTNNPFKALNQAINLLASDGLIYLICHPWCSRHGSHLYHDINKAYIHLVFTESELLDMGYKVPLIKKLIHPLGEYNDLFRHVGLRKISENIIRKSVEPFFTDIPLIKNRIMQNWSDSPDSAVRNGKFPAFQMEQEFCEFVLKLK